MWWLLFFILLFVAAVIFVKSLRMQFISKPAFKFIKKALPPLSQTEREAMEAGDIWWEGELFRGKPNWQTLHGYKGGQLTSEEQAFMDNEVTTLLTMIDDYDILQNRKDLPPEIWDYLRNNGFFALIIPKEYGGKDFSAYANSTIVTTIASRSLSVAVTVMVPNSLGPGELLSHYGTEAQKNQWLPGLASGKEIPCFALTGPEAGSDAGSIPDVGIVCKQEWQGEEVLGLSLTWNKRYITLAPVATVLGLAFQLKDPEGLLGGEESLGITCALIPADHPGVNIGNRHNPLNQAFMNGTTTGNDVFIPLDWIIGGVEYAGKGWRMLVECLSAGRGISLPGLATATGHMATRTTSAYGAVRTQFGMSISQFEGVQEALARIVSNTYQLEAARKLTTTGIDLKVKPSVVTAIAKYHMTELGRKVINDAMDIQSGKGIQMGPKNYLGGNYMANPISITVEGANILTRSLMIFGQGATRCHPYVLAEMEAAAHEDEKTGLDRFDGLLVSHMAYAFYNAFTSFTSAITGSRFNDAPVAGEVAKYYKHMHRFSAALAFMTDIAMLTLGGDLKRREMLSARLGDALSELYLASATLKLFADQGHQQDELPIVHHAMQTRLYNCAKALSEVIDNFPSTPARWLMQVVAFPLGNRFKLPSDSLSIDVCKAVSRPGGARERLTYLCPVWKDDPSGINEVEQAFLEGYKAKGAHAKIKKAIKAGKIAKGLPVAIRVGQALQQGLIDKEESEQILFADKLRSIAVQVDEFETL
ncbi:acyl-CoA dehydrogenase [Paraferrimonas sedimenticola]|uniref:Acyl-coenzyme A dehydrogenase n=1 Tax=Paraferrimonas sedimenticola TaxID=375674 RepID=A0AA37W0J0_9GAMM|nr:acyl-CoA dehydrogenase [Paraferrimonas sedimenticola]GLP97959.1 acyl-CoA dehydrogenase [Paraferrimonas sedimenticola]